MGKHQDDDEQVDKMRAAVKRRDAAQTELFKVLGLRATAAGLLSIIVIATVVAAYRQDANPYLQSCLIELAAGIATFLVIPLVLLLAQKFGKLVLVIAGVVAAGCAGLSLCATGVTQSFLIEAATGLLLAIALDVLVQRGLDKLGLRMANARAARDNADYEAESAASYLDDKYILYDLFHLPRPDQIGGMRADDDESTDRHA